MAKADESTTQEACAEFAAAFRELAYAAGVPQALERICDWIARKLK